MKKKMLCLSIILSLLVSMGIVSATQIRVDDYVSLTEYPVDSEFNVDVKIEGSVTNLFAFQFKLSWDPSVLELSGNTTYEHDFWPNSPLCPSSSDISSFFIACLANPGGNDRYNGSDGTLVTFRFKVLENSSSLLTLSNTNLVERFNGNTNEIHDNRSGIFINTDEPQWYNLRHEPSAITESDSVNIIIDWYDLDDSGSYNGDLDTVIIYENSTSQWEEHVCSLVTGTCSGETILGVSNFSILFFGLTSSFVVIVSTKIGKIKLKSAFKSILPLIAVILVIFLISMFLFPEFPRNISRLLSRLGIIPMVFPPKTFTHTIPSSNLDAGEVVSYYSFASDTSGNSAMTDEMSFTVQGEITPTCDDSDAGADFTTYGECIDDIGSYNDACVNSTHLKEYSCVDYSCTDVIIDCREVDSNYTCDASRCMFNATLTVSSTTTVPTVPVTTAPPGGNGGGGGGGAATVVSEIKTVSSITTGETGTFTYTKSATLGVQEIDVEVKNAVSSVQIKIKESSKPTGVDEPIGAGGKVYNYIEITKTNMEDADINKVKIKFKVNKSWVEDNGIDPDKVALSRYADDKWNKLFTTKLSEDNDYYYYEAESPGLSVFAITGEEISVTTVPAETTTLPEITTTQPKTTTTIPEEERGYQTYWVIGIVIIIAIVGIFVWFKFFRKTEEYEIKRLKEKWEHSIFS